MTSRIIDTQELGQVLLNFFGQYLVVLPGFSLRFSGDTVIASADSNRITNQGFILSATENPFGSNADAVVMIGTNGTLDNSGSIVALDSDGIELGGTNDVFNRGTIFGANRGILVTGDSTRIVNSGTIEGGSVGIQRATGDFMTVLNTGLIIGGQFEGIDAFTYSGVGSRIENSGTIAGASGNAINTGFGEDQVLNSGTLLGGAVLYDGNDLYDGRLGRVTGQVFGAGGDDTIWGGAGGETLVGNDGDDEILGAGGNDVIQGGAGGDLLDGGEGFDIASYASDSAGVLVDLQNAALNQGDAADDALLNFEGVFGGLGADTLRGNTAGNELRGGQGDDVLDGRAGTDTMRGGFGNDLMMVDNAGDRIVEGIGQGADTVMSAATYRLAPNAEVEFLTTLDAAGLTAINLTGSNTANTVLGNAGANRLTGLGGDDSLSGLAGADLLYGGSGRDTLLGGTEDDQLFGDDDYDTLDGGDGNDRLTGGDGDNSMIGGAGNDLLNGGDGNDRMTGGAGRDVFIFDTAIGINSNAFNLFNRDVITDFDPVEDTIRLSLSVFPALGALGALPATAFLSIAGGLATQETHRIIYDPTGGFVWYDPDGSLASARAQITVLPNLPANVTAADFVIIA